ncbi:chain length determinant protein [Vibrio ponticus]|nr:chain length determinant protein [Vibrio ponticus]
MSNTLNSQNTQLLKPSQFNSYNSNDEIDVRDLLCTIWQSKLLILGVTLLFSICASVFAYIQPNIYQAVATIRFDSDPYNFIEERGYNPSEQIANEANLAFPYLSGDSVKQEMISSSRLAPDSLNGLSITQGRGGHITISKQATSPEMAYEAVALFANHINDTYKRNELNKVESTLKLTEQLVLSQQGKVQEVLAEKYAQLLFKQAILQSTDSELVEIISRPVKPSTHIRPKRASSIALGTILGGMLGVAIVLIRFAFRREGATTE